MPDVTKHADALSGQSYSATKLAPEDEWIGKLDLYAFRDEIKALGKQLAAQQGPADLAHLNKIVWWSRQKNLPRQRLKPARPDPSHY